MSYEPRAAVELTICYGPFGEQSKTVALQIPEDLARELMQSVELSNDPFSLMLASPGLYGGRGNAITTRKKTFKMRRAAAEDIARAMVPAMLEAFGVRDELDGYRVADMSPDERAWHESKGRLPHHPPKG